MSDLHSTMRDDLPAYVLGSLDEETSARVEQHLQECDECQTLVYEYGEVLRLLPLGLPMAEPTRAARRELFNRLHRDSPDTKQRPATRWWPRLRLQALTAILVLGIVAAGAFFISQGGDEPDAAAIVENLRASSETRIVPMSGSGAASGAVAQLLFQPGKTRAGLVVSGLPLLGPDRAYQLWFVTPEDQSIDGGVFNVGAGGQAMVVVNAPADYVSGWECGITEEPAGGSDRPTGEHILTGSYANDGW